MADVDDIDFLVRQGKTFTKTIRVERQPPVYRDITGIANSAPVSITVPSHTVPEGWRVAVIDNVGMYQLNAKERPPRGLDWHRASVVNDHTLVLNDTSSLSFDPYVSGGAVMFYTPQPMTDYEARMEIRKRVGGELLDTLTTTNQKLIIDEDLHTLDILLDAETTEAYTWRRAVYELELVSPTGVVILVARGGLTLTREVTVNE